VGLLFLEAGAEAGGMGTSVERFAASAVSRGVEDGSVGGGWLRLAMGLRDAQPEKLTQMTHKTHSTQGTKSFVRENCERSNNCRRETRSHESKRTKFFPGGLFKARPAS